MKVWSNCDIISAEFYSNCSSKKPPEKNCSAGFGDYCCTPESKSAFYTKRDGIRVKTGISLFKSPKDNTEKRRWININSVYRRKGAGDDFSPYDDPKSTLFVNTTSKQTRYVLA